MNLQEIQAHSSAFRRALLESERRRILGVIAFLVVFAVGIGARIFIFGSRLRASGIGALLLVIVCEFVVLRLVDKALRTGADLPRWIFIAISLLEFAVPALGVAHFSSPLIAEGYRPLATPWVLAFFPFLLLSVLRLNQRACQISGIVAAAGYLLAALSLGWRHDLQNWGDHKITETAVLFYAAILIASGFVAGMVAGEIRRHVEKALREVELEGELKRVQHDLDIARTIQQSLLPKLRPDFDGFEVAGWNLPADATGGDYFDWKKVDGRLIITLADVTGHGVGPALLAALCRAYARSSFDMHRNLVQALSHINRFFGEDLAGDRFATFAAAVCSGDGTVELLSAGHGPLFVYSSTRDIFDMFPAQAIPLGLLPDLASGDPVMLNMEPGDLIVLATDGFFEWENSASEEFGVERMTEVIRAHRLSSPEEIIAELYSAVKTFASGTRQNDDLTAVVIKRTSSAISGADAPDTIKDIKVVETIQDGKTIYTAGS